MSDIKLFRLTDGTVTDLEASSVAVEKSLQGLIEQHLETFLGVLYVKTEHSTGPEHGGRIDTLGLDENGCPVIIEYKRSTNENVINQGLFYLDWLLDHEGDFYKLVLDELGKEQADAIDWSAPRLICIAGDFTKYDEHAVKQINRNIDLIRYRRYGGEFLLFELVYAASTGAGPAKTEVAAAQTASADKSFADQLSQSPAKLKDLYESLRAHLLALGDDVTEKEVKLYVAFRRIRNFACVVLHAGRQDMMVYVKVNPDEVALEQGFTRDVREIGHWATGDLEITIRTPEDLEKAEPLLVRSYESN